MTRYVLISLLSIFFPYSSLFALTSQTDVGMPRDYLYKSAKRYLLIHLDEGLGKKDSPIDLEDASAGLIRFSYRDDDFSDPQATLEVFQLNPGETKFRVTLPRDQTGRSKLLSDRIVRFAKEGMKKTRREDLPFAALPVYRSVKRFVLKNFVRPGEKIADVIRLESEDVGFLRFQYRENRFTDSNTMVYVVSLAKNLSRVVVRLSSQDTARQILLGDRLMQVVREDLGQPGN